MAQSSVVSAAKEQDYDSEFHYEQWTPRFNPWVITFTVTLATFMESLDSSIANVALPHIAGTLGASYDEATWILTSYLVSNAIVLADQRLDLESDWPQKFLHELRGAVHGVFVSLRAGDVAAHVDFFSSGQGSGRRWFAAE